MCVCVCVCVYRVLTELVSKMRDMQMDKTELGCLRAIVLFNPGNDQRVCDCAAGMRRAAAALPLPFRRRLLLLPLPLPMRRRRTHDGDTRTRILLSGASVPASTHLFLLKLTQQRLPFTKTLGDGEEGGGGGGVLLLLGVCSAFFASGVGLTSRIFRPWSSDRFGDNSICV